MTSVATSPVGSPVTAPTVVTSTSVTSTVASTQTDPHTLITGEDTAFDLSSPDSINSDSVEFASTLIKAYFDTREFGTSTLTFISDTVLVEPTEVGWLHWVPLPMLTPTESYFHLLGFDYIEVFAFLHLYPLWIALLYLSVSASFALIRSK